MNDLDELERRHAEATKATERFQTAVDEFRLYLRGERKDHVRQDLDALESAVGDAQDSFSVALSGSAESLITSARAGQTLRKAALALHKSARTGAGFILIPETDYEQFMKVLIETGSVLSATSETKGTPP